MDKAELVEVVQAVIEANKPKKAGPGRPKIDKMGAILAAIDRQMFKLSFDEFRDEALVEYPGSKRHPLDDCDETKIRVDLLSHGVNVYDNTVHDVLMHMAWSNTFHPVRQYFESLPGWDGTPRLERWLIDYLGVQDSRYVRKVGEAALIGAAKRILEPGCKFDEALVLISDEGSGKSSSIRALSPDERWVTDSLAINASPKQVIECTKGIWIVESAEMVGSKHIEQVKAFLSRQVDGPIRAAYARNSTSRARQFVVFGTTNVWKPLSKDNARRFWPVSIGCCDVEGLKRDRDLLWAEAYVKALQGQSTFVDYEIYNDVTEAQDKFATYHPWAETISDHVEALKRPPYIAVKDVWEWVKIDVAHQTREQNSELTNIMRKLGYTRAKEAKIIPPFGQRVRVFELINPFDPDFLETSISGKPVDDHTECMDPEEEEFETTESPVHEEFLEMLESPAMEEE